MKETILLFQIKDMKDILIYIILDSKIRKHLSTSVTRILRFSGCPELARRALWTADLSMIAVSTMAEDLPVFDCCVYSTLSSNP